MKAKPKPIRWSDLDGLGFKGANIFEPRPNEEGLFYRNDGTTILFVWEGKGGRFRLSRHNAKLFSGGRLSLVPPGCCNARGGDTRHFRPGTDSYGFKRDEFIEMAKTKGRERQ